MKRFSILFTIFFVMVTSCDDGFEDINENPNASTSLAPQPKLVNTLLRTSGDRFENWRGNLIYSSLFIQHHAALGGVWAGDKYFYNSQWSGAWFERGYNDQVKNIEDLLNQVETEDFPEEMIGITRILRVFIYHKITDLYGDVPYFEAGQGFNEAILRPVYDPQSEIYPDMLNELAEATAQLGSGTSQFGSSDILFDGDLGKWRRFGYSMMLRLGLRLVKVDPAAAQMWAQRAIDGGVMLSNADIAYIEHTDGPAGINRNGNGQVFQTGDSRGLRLSNTFVDALNGDPRLRIFAALPDPNAGDEFDLSGSNDPAVQQGLPNGLDPTTVLDIPDGDDINNFSEPNRNLITGEADPYFFQSYAEVAFMLAEAGVRWGIGGDPATNYANGVEAAMRQLDLYDIGDESVTDSEIADYLVANPFDTGDALNQINTQYWIATYLNHIESYANWRRTGFPVLTPVNFPGNVSMGQIPRRLRYFEREMTANATNYQAAVARQGRDEFFTRIWWDAE
ncbi:SusD/RagB family nutrient-binding outer membrane lipoprotein [Maribacter sp. 2210JD10-5]|uniref:SusD/RagB family nutrient-binding outer membrane lipoprotein n=1 Tax=Maribacter sp. 2210JD10-5 TaxID=3386272 RepID=UPI0039BC6F80